ncbi:MAG TPA: AmmeMemoRadiSam system protein B [Acidobacteriota bacterium]
MIRPPAVAGAFYPAAPNELLAMLRSLTPLSRSKQKAIALICPHAGYVYSGRVAGESYARAALPDRFIILCPNHRGLGSPLAVMSEGKWRTPLGDVPIDSDLAARLRRTSSLFEEDAGAHSQEHSLEVHLPFLQYLKEDFRFVPVSVGSLPLGELQQVGSAIARVIVESGEDVMIISSTDMTHYEPANAAREKDEKAISAILRLDAAGLYETVQKNRISMCGVAPTTVALAAARELGGTRAELVLYSTSGDVTGDYGSVVGYAGFLVY